MEKSNSVALFAHGKSHNEFKKSLILLVSDPVFTEKMSSRLFRVFWTSFLDQLGLYFALVLSCCFSWRWKYVSWLYFDQGELMQLPSWTRTDKATDKIVEVVAEISGEVFHPEVMHWAQSYL